MKEGEVLQPFRLPSTVGAVIDVRGPKEIREFPGSSASYPLNQKQPSLPRPTLPDLRSRVSGQIPVMMALGL